MAVFLLPASERLRRQLGLIGLLLLLGAVAWLPGDLPERTVGRVAEPLTRPLAAVAGRVLGALRGPVAAPAAGAPRAGLAEVERRLGRPAPVEGRRWIEAPVLAAAVEDGSLRVACAPDAAWEQAPVAFGRHYVGRVVEVEGAVATVRLWSAADARTGVVVRGGGRALTRAVCLGRGRGGVPVVGWIEREAVLQEGLAVHWRPRAGEAALAAADWLLGRIEQRGDAERGEALWVLEPPWPRGMRGRVYVCAPAGARAGVAALPRTRVPVAPRLLVDAVLGRGWAAVDADPQRPARVVVGPAGVAGEVVARRGRAAWLRRRAPAAWGAHAVVLGSGDPPRFLGADERAPADAPFQCFTRGGDGVPRGLWIGTLGQDAAPLAGELTALAQRVPAPR